MQYKFLTTVIRMSSHLSYLNLPEAGMKHCHPAAERNKGPILEALLSEVGADAEGQLLEVSSGSGQHVAHFAPNFPKIIWQPTEFESSSLKSIASYLAEGGWANVKQPQFLDVRQPPSKWLNGSIEPQSLDYILNINMIHISEWSCTEGLFAGCRELLKPGGTLVTYGPYADDGLITPQSNVQFDAALRSQDPSWGLRDISRQLVPLAAKANLSLISTRQLPANNKLLVWKKA